MKKRFSSFLAVFRRVLIVGAGVAAGIGVLTVLVATKPAPRKRKPRDTRPIVKVMTAEPVNHQAVVTGYGTAAPAESLIVAAELDGQIIEKGEGVGSGALLDKGALLFRIDDAELRVQIQSLEARIAIADAQLTELAEQDRANRLLLKPEQRSYELAKKEFERQVSLQKNKLASPSDVEKAETVMNDRLLAVQRRRASLAFYTPQTARIKAERKGILASKKSVELLLAKTVIRTPYMCRVEKVAAAAFSFVRTGQQLTSIFPVDAPFEVSIPLDKESMNALYDLASLDRSKPPWLQTELEAAVFWDGPEGSRSSLAKVDRVGAWLDPAARTVQVILQIDSPIKRAEKGGPRGLNPGTFVRADIRGRIFKNIFVIPEAAFRPDYTLFTAAKGRLKKTRIKPAAAVRGMVLVKPGGEITPGAKIVLHEIENAYDGMPVRIAGARKKAGRK